MTSESGAVEAMARRACDKRARVVQADLMRLYHAALVRQQANEYRRATLTAAKGEGG